MTFQLDTSGVVYAVLRKDVNAHADMTWSDLDPFTQGYVGALFASLERWPSTTFGDAKYPALPNANGQGVTIGLGFSDLAPETLARIMEDCAAALNAGWRRGHVTPRHYGATFWQTRQRGGLLNFPPLTVSLNDDGKVVFA